MKYVFETEEGRVVIDMSKDVCLYRAPRNPPNTGTDFTDGTDIYLHKTKKGKEVFYFYHWTMWQGCRKRIEIVTKNEVVDELLRHAGKTGWDGLDEEDYVFIKEQIGIDLLEETA